MRWAVPMLFASLGATGWTQDTKTDDATVVYVGYESRGRDFSFFLRRENGGGKELGKVELKRDEYFTKLRPTASGTFLGCRTGGIVELNREGKVVWEYKPDLKWDMAVDAHRLPNGNVLVAAMRAGKSFVAEADAKGKFVRQVELEFKGNLGQIRAAWVLENDRLLVASYQGVYEVDWDGKRHFEHALGRSGICYDVLPLAGGNFLFAGKGGGVAVAELTREGKTVWSASHGCPTSLQVLSSGNVVVGGG